MAESAVEAWEDDEEAPESSDEIVRASIPADLAADIVRSEVVERVFKSLAADAQRGDGRLQRSDVNRTYIRKQLSIAECIDVEERILREEFIIIDDDEDVPLDNGESKYAAANRKVRYLTHSEERELGRRIQLAAQLPADTSQLDHQYVRRVKREADMARGAFVASNLRYVEMLARRCGERRYIATEDLKQEGVIGLLRAVEKYDPERGFRFKTYATWWIQQFMNRTIADEDRIIRLPVHLQEKLVKIRRARSKLTYLNGKSPTDDELAVALGIDPKQMMKLLWRAQATEVAEGDSLISEDVTLLSLIPDQGASQFEILSQRELEVRIQYMLMGLTPREERVLRLRFGVGLDREHTLEAVGEQFGVTRERIRQIEAKSLRKLKHPSRSRYLKGFLDI